MITLSKTQTKQSEKENDFGLRTLVGDSKAATYKGSLNKGSKKKKKIPKRSELRYKWAYCFKGVGDYFDEKLLLITFIN